MRNGTRVDLDLAAELAAGCMGNFDVDGAELFEAVIAELRAAREVVKAARALLAEVTIDWQEPRQLDRALAAYDKVVGP
jgi:hypothetical protein